MKKSIVYIDTEIHHKSKKIIDLGAISSDGQSFHSSNVGEFNNFIAKFQYICGHNIIHHDLKYLQHHPSFLRDFFSQKIIIDTLYLSPLLFPKKPYHNLVKDDKLQTDDLNNPLNDSKKARDLFQDELQVFSELKDEIKSIYCALLSDNLNFRGFFEYVNGANDFQKKGSEALLQRIQQTFEGEICKNAPLEKIVANNPVELAYCLALIHDSNLESITPPWVLKNYPEVERMMFLLRNKPCLKGCSYCDKALDILQGLKTYFGFDSYRKFEGVPLQENAVQAAVNNKSLLAVFPTGGGKSLTFQVPALMAGRNTKGLTVVISPLQSLMKDQVDNLEKNNITRAVTINGLLDPIERAKSIERVANGSAWMLYISPESLRSQTIERLLLGRKIIRFVIDEAHCFSSWGQDFRVDYLYIGEFIKNLQKKKNRQDDPIPVSCFTATAKRKVVEDIKVYFKEKLSLELEVYKAKSTRKNLTYKVFSKDSESKYNTVRNLIEMKNCPTIIYVSRTRKAYNLAEQLQKDGFDAKPYHGKMDAKEKTQNQNDFINGITQIMVATSAFGMGVDKKDVGLVIHYEISDSLENYVQEAGRAGRDDSIEADCYVLFDEGDLDKHFILLNQTKLSVKEIQQIWRAIKNITKFWLSVSNSALEIARKAGWQDDVMDIETRVKTAISALEQSGYLKRGQNLPRIYANSILSKNAQEAIEKIRNSGLFNQNQQRNAERIIKKLFSAKNTKNASEEEAEARVDYISDHLGIVKEQVIEIITLLREANILADKKDLLAYIHKDAKIKTSIGIVSTFAKIEKFLLKKIQTDKTTLNLKELNEEALKEGIKGINPQKINTVFNYWAIKNWIKRKNQIFSKHHVMVSASQPLEYLEQKLEKRHSLAQFIIHFLFSKVEKETRNQDEILVEFSVHELKEHYENSLELHKEKVTIDDIEDSLFYLSRIEAIKIEGGFMVIYNKLTIKRLETNNLIQYKKEDYKQLEEFYQNKIQQIHIVGEYAKKMLEDYQEALTFVDDYFELNYKSFLRKYFPGSRRDELKLNITPKKFKQLFGDLSARQLKIINDNQSQHIVVAAGPGSGKTRVLVHKLASLLLMEDVKHEQLLMLTFSRAATTEFKKRLLKLIGNASLFVEIKTFHSYCFDILGRVGSIEKSQDIIKTAVQKIGNGEIEPNKIAKSVLVIDEAQDMDAHEFGLVKILMEKNPEMRVVAVGDDDQNIYTFRKADSNYFESFTLEKNAKKYELLENYRSKKNLVEFTNQFLSKINHRFKTNPIKSHQSDRGRVIVTQYRHHNFIRPLVEDIIETELQGLTGVLTKTNEEAIQITGLLLRNNFPAKLIQSNDDFDLSNLEELRFFTKILDRYETSSVISKEAWNNAKRKFAEKYKHSGNYDLCKRLLKDFQETNPKIKYRSDFDVFIRESKLEDFNGQDENEIIVSTIHKAKGKEFDRVFLYLNDFKLTSDDAKRQIYVAMTRAKTNLHIHYNDNYFNNMIVDDLTLNFELTKPDQPKQFTYHLTHRDINLGACEYYQNRINQLQGGDKLFPNNKGLINSQKNQVLNFSKQFREFREKKEENGFFLSEAKVNFILYWLNKKDEVDEGHEIKIVLPMVVFERSK